jgi:hypothetical protein
MVRSRGLLQIVECWVLKLLDCFHDIVTSFIVLLDIILNAFQQLAELCGVTGCSYVKDLILELGYLTLGLISLVVKQVSVLSPSFCRLCLTLFRYFANLFNMLMLLQFSHHLEPD